MSFVANAAENASASHGTDQLLVHLLSDSPDWSRAEDSVAWNLVKSKARQEGVAPLLAFVARSHVRAEEREWCHQVLSRSWSRHDLALSQLAEAVSVLDAAGIPSIPLKGPVLARRQYSPPFLRKPSGDLDFAVEWRHMPEACKALQDLGYVLAGSLREAQATSYHAVLRHSSRLPVELHFRLSHGVLGIPVEEFFPRAREYQIPAGRSVRVLDPADELMHLIIHLVDDRFATLFHSYELNRLWMAAAPSIRDQVVKKAIDFRFVGVLGLCNVAIRTVWGQPLFPDDFRLPKTWREGQVNKELFRRIAETAGHGVAQPLGKRLRGRWLDLQTTDSPRDAFRRVQSLLFVALWQIGRGNWKTGRNS